MQGQGPILKLGLEVVIAIAGQMESSRRASELSWADHKLLGRSVWSLESVPDIKMGVCRGFLAPGNSHT